MAYSILLVDDDSGFRDALRDMLTAEGYEVRIARNGHEALTKFTTRHPDLVLLDVMMPRMDGFHTCEKMREIDPRLPILFLTALDTDAEQVHGLGVGADDFLPKTVGRAVLLARVRRALARGKMIEATTSSAKLVLGETTIDFLRHEVEVNGRITALTLAESTILRDLAKVRGKVVTLDALCASLHGAGCVVLPSALRFHIMNLRKKLGTAGDMVMTKHTIGYYLVK